MVDSLDVNESTLDDVTELLGAGTIFGTTNEDVLRIGEENISDQIVLFDADGNRLPLNGPTPPNNIIGTPLDDLITADSVSPGVTSADLS